MFPVQTNSTCRAKLLSARSRPLRLPPDEVCGASCIYAPPRHPLPRTDSTIAVCPGVYSYRRREHPSNSGAYQHAE